MIARRVAELASQAQGKVNIALFAPWGAGKSSFNELLKEELQAVDPGIGHVTYDAWRNSGPGFHSNFLDSFAEEVEGKKGDTRRQLFDSATAVELPFGKSKSARGQVKTVFWLGLGVMVGAFLLLPLIWTVVLNWLNPYKHFGHAYAENIAGWAGFAASGTLLLTILLSLIQLSNVTVHRSAPSFVTQFADLFDKILAKGKKSRYVVFVDELDRCGPADVMVALEGLRTFLGDKRCVFVVAFDREAVAATIAQHIKHSVPDSASSPYYLTSGEYLDKIFQFQISLPPQSPHTFRPLAMSLVRQKGGVWRKLSEREDGSLERVVTLLSPMHLASPRRTKVLLNDFAVNARIFESLGFDWCSRSEEIAILTVLQTEFPRFAADLEREPSLIAWMKGDVKPTRQGGQRLAKQYGLEVELEDVTPEKTAGDVIVSKVASREKVVDKLLENLRRYIERLGDLNAPIPGADLIMMHSDRDLLKFSDSSVYQLVQVAVDMPRGAVLEALTAVGEGDRAAAIDYLSAEAERETPEAAKNLRLLVAEIAAGLPEMTREQAMQLLRTGRVEPASPITVLAARGFGNALVAAFNIDALHSFFKSISLESIQEFGTVLIAGLEGEDWVQAEETLSDALLEGSLESPSTVRALLERRAAESERGLTDAQIQTLVRVLQIDPLMLDDEDDLDDEAIERSELAHQAELEKSHLAIEEILLVWDLIPTVSGLRSDLLSALRSIVDETGRTLEMHDALLRADQDKGYLVETNEHLLTAIANQPGEHSIVWGIQLNSSTEVASSVKEKALRAVLESALESEAAQAKELAARCAQRIAGVPSEPFSLGELESRVIADCTRPWDEYSDTRLDSTLALLGALEAVSAEVLDDVNEGLVQVFSGSLEALQNDEEEPNATAMLRQLDALDKEHLERVVSRWEGEEVWSRARPEIGVEVLIMAQLKAITFGQAAEPVPVDAVNSLEDSTLVLEAKWLMTVPPGEDVIALSSFGQVSEGTWREFADIAPIEIRSMVWGELRGRAKNDENLSKMKSVATQGLAAREVDEAADRVISAHTVAQRKLAVRELLTIPAPAIGRGPAARVLSAMAQESKTSEIGDGVAIARHVLSELSASSITGLRPRFQAWAEASAKALRTGDAEWLRSVGLLSQKRRTALKKKRKGK
ncbi:KAP family P-loop NTPase fold protein [Leucobacter aridicollis]|uniref:KAP family P-loop NTPase fold protein n=1 Tax=Leucobacter aridicollis TaxID=283878 RepID=UPI0037CA9015